MNVAWAYHEFTAEFAPGPCETSGNETVFR